MQRVTEKKVGRKGRAAPRRRDDEWSPPDRRVVHKLAGIARRSVLDRNPEPLSVRTRRMVTLRLANTPLWCVGTLRQSPCVYWAFWVNPTRAWSSTVTNRAD